MFFKPFIRFSKKNFNFFSKFFFAKIFTCFSFFFFNFFFKIYHKSWFTIDSRKWKSNFVLLGQMKPSFFFCYMRLFGLIWNHIFCCFDHIFCLFWPHKYYIFRVEKPHKNPVSNHKVSSITRSSRNFRNCVWATT